LLFALVVAGMRHLALWCPAGRAVGGALVCAITLGYPLLALASLALEPAIPQDATHLQRARLLRQLQDEPGQHLILVRYLNPKPEGSGHEDWVWNDADIDASRVVWAREMDPDEDRQLLAYYAERRAWLLEVEVDKQTYRLSPHPLRDTATPRPDAVEGGLADQAP
jgi:hypothetical protein